MRLISKLAAASCAVIQTELIREMHLRHYFKTLLGGGRSAGSRKFHKENTLQPDAPFYAVGDVHGQISLLKKLLGQIDAIETQQLVFLGDYIDRGPDSAETLAYLFDLAHQRPDNVVCLMGNHEKMMCDFIDDPLDRGANWLRYGGVATLNSFGVRGIAEKPQADQAMEACAALEAAMPDGMLAWLRQLPLYWKSGNVWCVHAAMKPGLAPEAQRASTLLWGHRDFLNTARDDDICVLHGHTIVDQPMNGNSRISIDTGAYKTGRLTAAHLSGGTCRFLST